MGRREPAWMIERRLNRARDREEYLKNNPPQPSGTIEQMNFATKYYRSLFLKSDATTHRWFTVETDTVAFAKIGDVLLGVLDDLPDGEQPAMSARGIVLPTRAFWYKGTATPDHGTSPWGSKWAKYYAEDGGRSHYSAPLSKATGAFTFNDIVTSFNAIFADDTRKGELLGAKNGRAWLRPEDVSFSVTT